MARNFIQEMISSTKSRAETMERDWKLFQAGDIDKEEFESRYEDVLENMKEDAEDELESPNNGCKYNQTCPISEYFKTNKI